MEKIAVDSMSKLLIGTLASINSQHLVHANYEPSAVNFIAPAIMKIYFKAPLSIFYFSASVTAFVKTLSSAGSLVDVEQKSLGSHTLGKLVGNLCDIMLH